MKYKLFCLPLILMLISCVTNIENTKVEMQEKKPSFTSLPQPPLQQENSKQDKKERLQWDHMPVTY